MVELRDCWDLLWWLEVKDGENGGYGKKVILFDFNNCFIILDICDGVLL